MNRLTKIILSFGGFLICFWGGIYLLAKYPDSWIEIPALILVFLYAIFFIALAFHEITREP